MEDIGRYLLFVLFTLEQRNLGAPANQVSIEMPREDYDVVEKTRRVLVRSRDY